MLFFIYAIVAMQVNIFYYQLYRTLPASVSVVIEEWTTLVYLLFMFNYISNAQSSMIEETYVNID